MRSRRGVGSSWRWPAEARRCPATAGCGSAAISRGNASGSRGATNATCRPTTPTATNGPPVRRSSTPSPSPRGTWSRGRTGPTRSPPPARTRRRSTRCSATRSTSTSRCWGWAPTPTRPASSPAPAPAPPTARRWSSAPTPGDRHALAHRGRPRRGPARPGCWSPERDKRDALARTLRALRSGTADPDLADTLPLTAVRPREALRVFADRAAAADAGPRRTDAPDGAPDGPRGSP